MWSASTDHSRDACVDVVTMSQHRPLQWCLWECRYYVLAQTTEEGRAVCKDCESWWLGSPAVRCCLLEMTPTLCWWDYIYQRRRYPYKVSQHPNRKQHLAWCVGLFFLRRGHELGEDMLRVSGKREGNLVGIWSRLCVHEQSCWKIKVAYL